MTLETSGEHRVVPLEALRGLAAVIVFFCHFLLAFLPQRHGQLDGAIVGGNVMETPLFFLFNGSAAVTFFFVLSGFVLTAAFLRDGDTTRLTRGALKRWPRLTLLPLASTLLVYLLFRFGAFRHVDAAAFTGSEWLRTLAFTHLPQDFVPDFGAAFAEGAYRTFFFGDSTYNSNLWTMRIEFFGTFLAFGLAALVQRARPPVALALLALALTMSLQHGAPFIAFVFGVGGAYFWTRRAAVPAERMLSLPNRALRVAAVGVCLYLLGYLPPGKGVYGWMYVEDATWHVHLRYWLHSIASIGLIWLVLDARRARRWLSLGWARRLGDWSFPLYVMQIPLLGSLSCALYLGLRSPLGEGGALAVSFVLSFVTLCAISEGFGRLDKRWCGWLNRLAVRAVPKSERAA